MKDFFSDEDDDFFSGSPEDKYRDIISNANKNLVENEVLSLIKKLSTIELLLEEKLQLDDIEDLVKNYGLSNIQDVNTKYNSNLILSMSNILSLNE